MIIYLIKNKVNGKGYVGQTVRSWEERWYEHCHSCREVIDKAIRKYGVENFEICILEETDNLEDLNKLETEHILKQGTLSHSGYNLNTGGKNHIPTAETRAKLSAIHKGNKYRLGLKLSPEHIAKIVAANKGNKYNLGRKTTEETRKKLSDAHKGKKMPPRSKEWKLKQSIVKKGLPWSESRRLAQSLKEKP